VTGHSHDLSDSAPHHPGAQDTNLRALFHMARIYASSPAGYQLTAARRWRFPFEQAAITTAINSARSQLGPPAEDAAEAEGQELTWPEAVQYARRARAERKRLRQGWAALTPTALQVVELIGEGLTNQQIAERLIMGRATVKPHLQHIFAKLDINSRTQLAAQVTRRNG
jgi:DNA-binding CsgD family transcriptional regulator